MVTTMEAAMIDPQGCSYSLTPPNWDITTGTVFIVSEKHKDFNVMIEVKRLRPKIGREKIVAGPERCHERADKREQIENGNDGHEYS
jgi:hypothetical protein